MKLDFSFGCMGWKVGFFMCFFPPLGIQGPCVSVHMQWGVTVHLWGDVMHPEFNSHSGGDDVTREDAHTGRTFRYQLQFGLRARQWKGLRINLCKNHLETAAVPPYLRAQPFRPAVVESLSDRWLKRVQVMHPKHSKWGRVTVLVEATCSV